MAFIEQLAAIAIIDTTEVYATGCSVSFSGGVFTAVLDDGETVELSDFLAYGVQTSGVPVSIKATPNGNPGEIEITARDPDTSDPVDVGMTIVISRLLDATAFG